jgi:hypothetical protein
MVTEKDKKAKSKRPKPSIIEAIAGKVEEMYRGRPPEINSGYFEVTGGKKRIVPGSTGAPEKFNERTT